MIVDVKEHSVVECSKEYLESFTDKIDKKYLGLHKEFQNGEIILKSHYYIGYRWFDEKKEEYIHVSPKESNSEKADYLKMFLECLKDPDVSKKLDETYQIFFNKKWIKIEEKKDEITPLIILHFLKIVDNISKKGLKKGYIKVTENLTSKIKGRILVNQTIKHNHFKNRLDKTVCTHQIFTTNCIENRILKTALSQCARNLQGIENNEIKKLLKFNLSSFELVDTKEIFSSDFAKIKHSPFYKEYKEALKLAQMIFKRFGFTLNSSNKEEKIKIPPFYINMSELFERYVEVRLRKIYPDIIDGNRDENFEFKMKPDFLLPSKNMILDAKYKYWYDTDKIDDRFKDDFQQLSLYGREQKIRKIIGLENSNVEAEILFIYPKDGEESIVKDSNIENFNNIEIQAINIPTL